MIIKSEPCVMQIAINVIGWIKTHRGGVSQVRHGGETLLSFFIPVAGTEI